MVEMLPGLAVEKHYLSPNDLKHHVYPPHCYSPQDLSRASMKTRGLETSLQNPQTKISETVLDIIAFSLDKVIIFVLLFVINLIPFIVIFIILKDF